MASFDFRVYDTEYFYQAMRDRFYPRDLINADNLRISLKDSIRKLNDYVYLQRFYELPASGGGASMYLDLNQVQIEGVMPKKVTEVYSSSQIDNIYNIYTQVLGQTPFFYNIVRNQDTFIEFILTKQVQEQLNRNYKNKATGFMQISPDRVLLDPRAYSDTATCVIMFYPYFDIDNGTEWELMSQEVNFVLDYMEALISFREGRAQGEMNFTELSTNADSLKEDGKEALKEIIATFKNGSIMKLGKRF